MKLKSVFLILLAMGLHASSACAMARGPVELRGATPEMLEEQEKIGIDFRNDAGALPRYLIKEVKLETFAGISLPKLLEEIQTVQVFYRYGLMTHGYGPNGEIREGGSNFTKGKKVFFSQRSFNELNGSGLFVVFALHECLGALNYQDDDYQLSFGMYLASRQINQSRIDFLAKVNGSGFREAKFADKKTMYASNEGGGATGIGKGGDTIGMRMKQYIFEQTVENMNLIHTSLAEFSYQLNRVTMEPAMWEGMNGPSSNMCKQQLYRFVGKPTDPDFKIQLNRNAILMNAQVTSMDKGVRPCPKEMDEMTYAIIGAVDQRTE